MPAWHDWAPFVEGTMPEVRRIARLDRNLMLLIGARYESVFLRRDYALKMMRKHGLGTEHMALLPITISLGRCLFERERHLTFFFHERVVFGRWFHASIKANGDGSETWVATFHKTRIDEVERISRRSAVIRPDSETGGQ